MGVIHSRFRFLGPTILPVNDAPDDNDAGREEEDRTRNEHQPVVPETRLLTRVKDQRDRKDDQISSEKMEWETEILRDIRNNLSNLTLRPDFYLKVIAFSLTIVTTLFWRIPPQGLSGMNGSFQELMFSHTVPGYLTIMFGLVVIYILGDTPSPWFYYVFYISGVLQFLVVGLFGLWNCLGEKNDWDLPPLCMAVTNLLTGLVIGIDLFWSTALFGFIKIARESVMQHI